VLDCELELDGARDGERVQLHHGTRAVPARLRLLEDERWQLRLEQPLFAIAGDRLVVGRIAPRDTLGGGVVLDARARRHGGGRKPRAYLRSGGALEREPPAGSAAPRLVRPRAAVAPAREDELALRALEQRLRDAGMSLISEAQLGAAPAQLRALRADGRAARVSGRLYAHADVLAEARRQILALIERDGSTTLAAVRDALGTSRKSAQAFLEHLDGARLTRRLPDDRRVLAHRGVLAHRHAPAPR